MERCGSADIPSGTGWPVSLLDNALGYRRGRNQKHDVTCLAATSHRGCVYSAPYSQ